MKEGNGSEQMTALLGRTWHSVWHHDWKIIVGVGVLLVLNAAREGWQSSNPRPRSRRSF